MKKKIALVVTLVLLICAVISPSAMACERSYNQKNYRAAVAVVNDCNDLIEIMVRCAQLTPYNDVPALLVSVNVLVASTTAYVQHLGFDVECEYTKYIIDGQKVYIDPLRVINPLDPDPHPTND